MSAGDKPTLTDAVTQAIESLVGAVHTSLPGRVESYDETKALASVQPVLKRKYTDDTVQDMPVIANVPVLWPRTAKAMIHLPLNKGDYVLLIFAERSLDSWLSKGGITEPLDRRKHSLTDAIAIPGLFPFVDAPPIDNNEDVIVKTDKAIIRIKPDGTIELGEDVKALVNDSFRDIFDKHVHNFTAAPSGAFSTSVPARVVGTTPLTPVGGAVALFDGTMIDGNLTSKTEAE